MIKSYLAIVLVVSGVYSNHFYNSFHFDDFHTIENNLAIRHLSNIPRFFMDTSLSSTLPDHMMYRPIVESSLAVDWKLGNFHYVTFGVFLVQLFFMLVLFHRVMNLVLPTNWLVPMLGTLCYGIHPVNAETVNYIIQRAEIYSTVGLVASLVWFMVNPKYGLFVIPAVLSFLSKAPALVFVGIVGGFVWLWREKFKLKNMVPLVGITILATILIVRMTPNTFSTGAMNSTSYIWTQPFIILRYFSTFFVPINLSADTDLGYVQPLSIAALVGYLFVGLLLAMIYVSSLHSITKPISFGLIWFLVALLPTSLMPLAEVTNDHRMYFPFVGLTLAVFWTLNLVIKRLQENVLFTIPIQTISTE